MSISYAAAFRMFHIDHRYWRYWYLLHMYFITLSSVQIFIFSIELNRVFQGGLLEFELGTEMLFLIAINSRHVWAMHRMSDPNSQFCLIKLIVQLLWCSVLYGIHLFMLFSIFIVLLRTVTRWAWLMRPLHGYSNSYSSELSSALGLLGDRESLDNQSIFCVLFL